MDEIEGAGFEQDNAEVEEGVLGAAGVVIHMAPDSG